MHKKIIKLLAKTSTFAFLLRWVACSNAHLRPVNCASRCAIRLAKKQNSRFYKKFIVYLFLILLTGCSTATEHSVCGSNSFPQTRIKLNQWN